MELAILDRITVGEVIRITPVVRLSPVASAIEELLLRSFLYSVLMSHLKNICLAAVRPALRLEVVAHHPERRPEAVRCLRELDGSHNITILEIYLSEGDKTCRCSL